MFVMSQIDSLGPLWSYCDSGVCDHSWNISSIIVPRCLCSDSLILLEHRSLESCSKEGIGELILVRSGIGRGISSSHPQPGCLIRLDMLADNYCLHVGTIPNKTVGSRYDQCCIADGM